MRKILVNTVILLFLINPISGYSLTGYYTNLQGNIVDFNIFDGDYVLVEAFQTQCSFCEDQFPVLQEIYRAYSKYITILSLAIFPETDSLQDVIDFDIDHTASWLTGLDSGEFKDDYSISATPTLLLFNTEGQVIDRFNKLTSFNDLSQSIEAYVEIITETDTIETADNDWYEGSWLEWLLEQPMFRMSAIIAVVLSVYIKFGVKKGIKE